MKTTWIHSKKKNAYRLIDDTEVSREIEQATHLHHTALCNGYCPVDGPYYAAYNGRFGEGYMVFTNNPKSTRYCFVDYMIYN